VYRAVSLGTSENREDKAVISVFLLYISIARNASKLKDKADELFDYYTKKGVTL